MIEVLQQNGEAIGKRKMNNCNLDERRKKFKLDIDQLLPEKMPAIKLCLALQERGVDIEDVRDLLIYKLRKFHREELDKSNVRKEWEVEDELTEDEMDEYLELESDIMKENNCEKDLQNKMNLTTISTEPAPSTSLTDLPDLAIEIIVRYLSYGDLCNLALTSKRMKCFALNPNFFTDFGLSKKNLLATKLGKEG